MREVAIPNFSPMVAHTPNACHSIKYLSLFIPQFKNLVSIIYKLIFYKFCFNVNSQHLCINCEWFCTRLLNINSALVASHSCTIRFLFSFPSSLGEGILPKARRMRLHCSTNKNPETKAYSQEYFLNCQFDT